MEDELDKPYFITEHGGRLFKVLGGHKIELPDGSTVTMNPEMVIDAPITEKKQTMYTVNGVDTLAGYDGTSSSTND